MFSSPLTFSFCSPVKRPVGVGVMALPPVTENLLAFLRGNSSETEKLDSYKKPLTENFVMSQAPCIEVNGTDNTGTTAIDHGAIVSSEGSATVAYDGTTLSFSTAGTFYNVTFADGTHFACAENSGLYSFSDDGSYKITWTGVEAELRAGRQDTYFCNDVNGWYEIDGDSVKYPYPVAGYTSFHKGGTFNNSGTSFAPATTPVGTGNGVDMFIDMDEPYDFVDGDTVSFSFLKNADDIPIIGLSVNTSQYIRIQGEFLIVSIDSVTKSTDRGFINGVYYFMDIVRTGNDYAIYINDIYKTTISISGTMIGLHAVYRRGGAYADAIVRNLKLGNRPVIPINEGSGYDIHDSLGNVVGTLSGDETFWNGPEMVSDEIIKQETIKTTPVFTDGNGHPVAMTQEEWEANTEINTNKQDYLRTGTKTELAMYSAVQSTENDAKLLEWAGIIDNVYAAVNLDGSQALNPDGSAAANPTT